MSDIISSAYVRRDLLTERPAPVKTTGFIGLMRTRLFNSPTNILLTIVGALLLWFTVIPAVKFLMVDAVWTGKDRTACLTENAGFTVGACWPFIQAKLPQLIYGFYPEAERWRVNLALILAAALLLPLLIPRLPAKGLNASLFFFAFPVVAFFLLHGGGITGFGLSWTAGLLQLFDDSIIGAGQALLSLAKTSAIAPLFWLAGNLIVLVGSAIYWLIFPLTWLRDQLQGTGQSVWADFAITAAVVSLIAFAVGGGVRTGGRALTSSVGTFIGIAAVIKLMGLDHGGLPVVTTNLWGGLLVTLVVSVTGIVTSLPIGIALALGRRSTIPLIRIFSIAFIEFWRGVPLITVLFFATYMLPLFLPGNFTVDGLVRALIGISLFTGAYQAENVRGGLAAIPRGQGEAAAALGLSWWKTTSLIVLPQALRHVIPNLVNSFISLFKDTSLVSIVALFDLLGSLRASFSDPKWSTPSTAFTGFAFAGIIYFIFCFGMSRIASTLTVATDRGHHVRPHRQDFRPQQMVRRVPRAARHRPRGQEGRAHRDLRPLRLGQVDVDPLHQRARGIPGGRDRRRRHRARAEPEARRCGPPRGRHGVPELQPVPASDRPGELHAGADLGAEHPEEGRRGQRDEIPGAGQDPAPGQQVSWTDVRRPAAARRDRTRADDEPQGDAVRRADLGARPRNGQGSARHHGRPRRGGHDHAGRHS
jgi:general L-amino acid transport system permease protein